MLAAKVQDVCDEAQEAGSHQDSKMILGQSLHPCLHSAHPTGRVIHPRWLFMLRTALWVSLLSISLAAFSQVSAPPSQDNTTVPVSAPLPGGYGGTVWTGPGQVSGVLLTTPSATFAPTPTTAGISDAGRAGISDSTPVNTGIQVGPPAAAYVYMPYPSPEVVENSALANGAGGQPSGPSKNDLLPSYFVNNVGTPVATGPSLAEIAARYGRHEAPSGQGQQNVKTYTNSDIPRENAGLLTKIWVAEGKLPSAAQASPTLMASASSEPPLPAAQAQSSASTGTSQGEQAQPEKHNGELPASATILPLLSLLGLASGGLGLLLKRRR